jgi:hypothetical protein
MRIRTCVMLAACLLAGCENPQGQTERFLAGDGEGRRRKERAETCPATTQLQAREVPPLVIERDPFKRISGRGARAPSGMVSRLRHPIGEPSCNAHQQAEDRQRDGSVQATAGYSP